LNLITDIIGYIFNTVWLPIAFMYLYYFIAILVIPLTDRKLSKTTNRINWICSLYQDNEQTECFFTNLFKSSDDKMIY